MILFVMLRRNLVVWLKRRTKYHQDVVNGEDIAMIRRYAPFWPDESIGEKGNVYNKLPWWRPFNILLHAWNVGQDEIMHDHPRWTITICLKGTMIERTPWQTKTLTPGCFVIRSRKYIHGITIPPQPGKVWTLFIVGPRKYKQNWFKVVPIRPL